MRPGKPRSPVMGQTENDAGGNSNELGGRIGQKRKTNKTAVSRILVAEIKIVSTLTEKSHLTRLA